MADPDEPTAETAEILDSDLSHLDPAAAQRLLYGTSVTADGKPVDLRTVAVEFSEPPALPTPLPPRPGRWLASATITATPAQGFREAFDEFARGMVEDATRASIFAAAQGIAALATAGYRPREPYRCADPKLRPDGPEQGEWQGWCAVLWEPCPGWTATAMVQPDTFTVDNLRVWWERGLSRPKRPPVLGEDDVPLWHLPLTPAVLRARIARLEAETLALRRAELQGGGLP